jgi:hypothetical protein
LGFATAISGHCTAGTTTWRFLCPAKAHGLRDHPIGPDPVSNYLARNVFTGTGYADVDLSVIKNISIGERWKIQLRAEMFNLFNRINLASGAGSVGSNGYVSDTIGDFNGAPGLGPGEPFNMQLAAKIPVLA